MEHRPPQMPQFTPPRRHFPCCRRKAFNRRLRILRGSADWQTHFRFFFELLFFESTYILANGNPPSTAPQRYKWRPTKARLLLHSANHPHRGQRFWSNTSASPSTPSAALLHDDTAKWYFFWKVYVIYILSLRFCPICHCRTNNTVARHFQWRASPVHCWAGKCATTAKTSWWWRSCFWPTLLSPTSATASHCLPPVHASPPSAPQWRNSRFIFVQF